MCVRICCLWYVCLPRSKRREWYFHLSQRKIAISFIISSHLYSQSQGAPPPTHSPMCTLKSHIFRTLFTVFPLAISYLFLSTLCLLLAHCIFYSHISPCFFSFFVSFHLALSHSHGSFFWQSSSAFSFALSLSSSDCWFRRRSGRGREGHCRDEWSLYQSGISSPPDWFPPALQSHRCIIHLSLALCL